MDNWLEIPYENKDMENVRQIAIKKIKQAKQEKAREMIDDLKRNYKISLPLFNKKHLKE